MDGMVSKKRFPSGILFDRNINKVTHTLRESGTYCGKGTHAYSR